MRSLPLLIIQLGAVWRTLGGGGGVAESKMETEEGQKKAQKNAKMRLYTVRKKDERNQEAGRKEGGRKSRALFMPPSALVFTFLLPASCFTSPI